MKINVENIVSVSQVSQKGISWLVSQAEAGNDMLILKNSEPAVVVSHIDTMTRLSDLEEFASDLRLLAATMAREAVDSGERFDLNEVLNEFDVVLDGEN
ncbi:MAG: hypothetical protein E6Q27_00125 [Aeromicrobium sp.]|jgi:hypothetical protein|nr:MAG: hypothetical protein E6Q27_00125 [Aeromicrobium sp.]